MKEYYFYCPNCKSEHDGYGAPIHHYECPHCHNLDAGYMRFGLGKMDELPREEQEAYFRDVIGMYQSIRGIKRPNFEELLALDTVEQVEMLTGV